VLHDLRLGDARVVGDAVKSKLDSGRGYIRKDFMGPKRRR